MPKPNRNLEGKLHETRGVQSFVTHAYLYLIANRGDKQVAVAKALGTFPSALSEMQNGKRGWSPEYIDKLSAYYQMEPDELIALGRQIMDKVDVNPFYAELKKTKPFSEERLTLLFKLIAGDTPFAVIVDAMFIKNAAPPVYEAYLNKEISDGKMYAALSDCVVNLIKATKHPKIDKNKWYLPLMGTLPETHLDRVLSGHDAQEDATDQ